MSINPQTLDNSYNTIQVFPTHANTFQGTASSMDISGYKIIHADKECTITQTFEIESDLVLTLAEGEDVGVAISALTLTSDGSVKVS